jgi:hypothetical protein
MLIVNGDTGKIMHRVIKLTSFLVFIFVIGLFQLSCYYTSSLILCAYHILIFMKWKILEKCKLAKHAYEEGHKVVWDEASIGNTKKRPIWQFGHFSHLDPHRQQ